MPLLKNESIHIDDVPTLSCYLGQISEFGCLSHINFAQLYMYVMCNYNINHIVHMYYIVYSDILYHYIVIVFFLIKSDN